MNEEVLEQWKDIYFKDSITNEIIDYRNFYQVSNLGRVKSLRREITQNGNKKTLKERILKLHPKENGYFQVSLNKDGKEKRFLIHRLVAHMFIPNPENKPEVDHIIPISNGGNHSVENLRWVTKNENMNNEATIKNMIDSNRHLSGKDHPMYNKYGKENHSSKKVNQFDLNGIFIKTWDSIHDVARFFDVNASAICSCCNKRSKSSCGFIWSYETNVHEYKNNTEKQVIQMDMNGNFIKEFKRIKDAVEELNLKEGSRIGLCCKGKANSAYGFKWKYKGDNDER